MQLPLSATATQPFVTSDVPKLQSYVVLADSALGIKMIDCDFTRCGGADPAWPLGQRRIAEGVCGRGLPPHVWPSFMDTQVAVLASKLGQVEVNLQTLEPTSWATLLPPLHQVIPKQEDYMGLWLQYKLLYICTDIICIQISFNFPLIFQTLVHNKLAAFIRWGYKMHERVLFGKSVKVQVGPFSSREEQQVQRWRRMSRMSRHHDSAITMTWWLAFKTPQFQASNDSTHV